MAKRRIKRRRRSTLRASTALAAPRRRRRRSAVTTTGRRRRRRGLSAGTEIINFKNPQQDPLIMGAAGGAADMVVKGLIPKVVYQNADGTERKYGKILKGVALLVGAYAAKAMKQPFLAAGMAGGAAVLTMQSLKMLDEGGNFRQGRFVRNSGMMMQGSNGSYYLPERIYPNYFPLYEQELLSDAELLSESPTADLII